jgi:hypothetical protein
MIGVGSAVLAAIAPFAAGAAEIDSVTGRELELEDSSRALEDRLNGALEAGVERANAAGGVCDEEDLYRELRHAFASPFIGHWIAESLNADETLDLRRVKRVDSIYRDLGLFDNVSVHWKDLSGVVRVGDTVMGVDKVGHFIVEGWSYFERAYLDGRGVEEAMAWGEGTEETYFGLYTTGVRSYADLVADFEGMRFWLRITGSGDDPLGQWRVRHRPYVRCRRRYLIAGERRWQLVRRLDLGDYVQAAWDEAINCCEYRNEEIEALVRHRVEEVSRAAGVDFTCPVDPAGCADARERYGDWAPRLLHPDCLDAESARQPWWRFWR